MPYLTVAELSTHIYGEIIDQISRNDDSIAEDAIVAAIEEASGYLAKFDIAATFAATGDARNPLLAMYVKDIATWHFIQLANPNIEMSFREVRYNHAIKWLEKVQRGIIVPALPLPAPDITVQTGSVRWGQARKQQSGSL
jgi:phage gp36-like protein